MEDDDPDPSDPQATDLVERDFNRPGPNVLRVADIERHEALWNREELRDLFRRPVAAGW